MWKNFIDKYKENDIIKGKVARFVEFGAFIDLGGFDGLLHKNDITWKKVFKKKNILKLDEEMNFVIISINYDDRKVGLSLKKLIPDPWENIEKGFKPGTKVSGIVSTVTNFGIFVEVEDGVEGLIKSSDISWTKNNINPKTLYKISDPIDAVILDININEKKLSLGLKQLTENPWSSIDKRVPIGSIRKGIIRKITDFGIFVNIEEDIDGLIHISDLAWDESSKQIISDYKAGDTVEFKVLAINKTDERISCGVKQLIKSPWDLIKDKYPVRTKINVEVASIKPMGIEVKIEDGIFGFIPISEASKKRTENLQEIFNVGDTVEAMIIEVNSSKRKMLLSIKSIEIISEKEELSKVLNLNPSNTASIAELLNKKR